MSVTEIDPIPLAAREALRTAGWDGHDPRTVAGLVLAMTDELYDAGYTRRHVSEMLRRIGDHLEE